MRVREVLFFIFVNLLAVVILLGGFFIWIHVVLWVGEQGADIIGAVLRLAMGVEP